VEVEDLLLADLAQPLRGAFDESPRVVEDPDPNELETASTSPDAETTGRRRRSRSARRRRPDLDSSIAPSAARIRSGSAPLERQRGRAVASVSAEEPSTISEFVPTSMNRRTRRSSVSPVARMPATMSGPT
jgi:hypothetical protein